MVSDPRFFPRPGRANDAHSSLSLAERDRRWGLVRAEMARRGIDCLVVIGSGVNGVGNCRWLDNADAAERSLMFPAKGEPMILYGLPGFGKWYARCAWEGVGFRGIYGQISSGAAEYVIDHGYAKGTVGIVGLSGGWSLEGSISYFTFENLKRLLPDATFVNATDMLYEVRTVKSAEEIALIEKAAELSNIEFDNYLKNARPGVRELQLYADAYHAAMCAGNDIGGDYTTLLCSGKDEGYHCMRRPTDRMLKRGDLVMIAHYTRFGGYWSHPHTAISLGPLDEEYRPMRDAVYEATQRALELIKPGAAWDDIMPEMDKPVLERGYYFEICHIHGVGLDGNEPPRTAMRAGKVPNQAPYRTPPLKSSIFDNPEYRKHTGDRRNSTEGMTVKEGMALAIEVTACKDDRLYMEFGPQVVVDKAGTRVLTPDACDVIEI